jgi:macrolide transport system ATP-binding/permease protein
VSGDGQATTLLSLRGVSRSYGSGEARVTVLHDINLDIRRGEFVVIVGQSGSGKSTLMNILGCLDQPSSGEYRIRDQATEHCDADALARLRRETFGFIFQRYHLVANLNALENTEIPAIYAGQPVAARHARAAALLAELGLSERAHHKPSELSGGQQQRVSIARALMNNGEVILADEPTGALDSESGHSVLDILHRLHAQGHTIIVVTHDAEVAQQGQRRVRLLDGRVVEDCQVSDEPAPTTVATPAPGMHRDPSWFDVLRESLTMAMRTIAGNRLRAALTMLGIIIGVSSVVAMLGIGQGAQVEVAEQIEALGADLLTIRAGERRMRGRGGETRTLVAGDVSALTRLPGVAAVIPESDVGVVVRYDNIDAQSTAVGTGPDAPFVRDWGLSHGVFFTPEHEQRMAQVVVLGADTADNLFGRRNPVGEYLLVNNSPFLVIGVMEAKGVAAGGGWRNRDDQVWMPSRSLAARISGQPWYQSVVIKVAPGHTMAEVAERADALLLSRHGRRDFNIMRSDEIIETRSATQRTFAVLLGAIAVISLLVGGIGVMNIMLVSVTERISEIGIRMAVGARPRDVLAQFLVEALVLCFLGGAIGVALGLGSAWAMQAFGGWRVVIGAGPVILAFSCAFLTGVIFGFLPARKASRLTPVDALTRE